MQVLGEHAEDLLKAAAFTQVTRFTLVSIVKKDDLDVTSEMSVVETCLRWARISCMRRKLELSDTNLRSAMGPEVVLYLRLLTLSPTNFAKGPGAQNWLTAEEKASLFQSLLNTSNSKLSKGLCTNKTPRENRKGQLYKRKWNKAEQDWYHSLDIPGCGPCLCTDCQKKKNFKSY